ncbi:MAG: hypothetical protein JNL67_17170 [Planctomycetaceae bacterium]|nr:hypothetical protein [Planctomycetaceae bacterium]
MAFLQYLAPRIALLSILATGIWASSELMTRNAINNSSILSPLDVTVDHASVQWQDRTVTMRNLLVGREGIGRFQADKVSLKLDPNALIDQRWVVLDGMMTNPSLVTEEVSGNRTSASKPNLSNRLSQALQLANQGDANYQSKSKLAIEPTWLQQIQAAEKKTTQAGNHTLQVLDALQKKWEAQLAVSRQAAAKLQEQVTAARLSNKQPNNPLRNDARLNLTRKVNELNQEILNIRQQIEQIQRAATADIAAATETVASEIEGLDSVFRLPVPAATSIDVDLLSHQPPQPIQDMFQWVDWAQAVVPSVDVATAPVLRGRQVAAGREELPSLEIQKLTLVGVSNVGNNYYRLMGSLNNLSNRPYAQRSPASLSLRAQGDHHVIINGLYDQRNGHCKSYFSIRSLDLVREDGLALLKAEEQVGLPIQVAPGKYTAHLNLNLDGENLEGQLLVRHTQSGVECDLSGVHDPALVAILREELQGIHSYVVAYDLKGTTDKIVATCRSDLGEQIAQVLGAGVKHHFTEVANAQALAVKQSIQGHQERLQGWVNQETQQLMAVVQQEMTQVASLESEAEPIDSLRLR